MKQKITKAISLSLVSKTTSILFILILSSDNASVGWNVYFMKQVLSFQENHDSKVNNYHNIATEKIEFL